MYIYFNNKRDNSITITIYLHLDLVNYLWFTENNTCLYYSITSEYSTIYTLKGNKTSLDYSDLRVLLLFCSIL